MCSKCSGTVDYCIACTSGALLYNNSCYSYCPEYTVSVNSICNNCTSPCTNCAFTTTHCTDCEKNYYLYNNQCLQQCPSLTTITYESYCSNCNSPCFTCMGIESNCTTCIANYYLFNNTCVEKCPSGYGIEGNSCININCSPGCTIEMLNNSICDSLCNLNICNWDNGMCNITNSSGSLAIAQAPLPFTVASVGTSSILAASKIFFPTTSFISATLGV